jgi:glycosyltransferase involved in cell wall biosynthesis
VDPLISCLMVTRGRFFPTRFAIDCYLAQSYENRELVIVCDEPDSPVAAYVTWLNNPTIRYIETKKAILGDLRNLSLDEARGPLVCQWDDDDLYHPKRLEFQAEVLREEGTAAHFLARWMMWWPNRRKFALSGVRAWEGTMLARRDALGRYPAAAREEDTQLVGELLERHKVSVTDAPDVYCYIVHGRNTCDEAHFNFLFEKASWVYSDYEAELAKVALHLPLRDYEEELRKASKGEVQPPPFYSGRRFGAEHVGLDGATFADCTFNGTSLVYNGGKPPLFDGCSFNYVGFDFEGPAKDTVALVRWLVDQGIIPGITKS